MAKHVLVRSVNKIRPDFEKQKASYLAKYIDELSKLGYRAILYAYQQGHTNSPKRYEYVDRIENGEVQYYKSGDKEGEPRQRKSPVYDGKWRHKTRNLHDSFGSAVYLDGEIVENSFKVIGTELSRKKDPVTGMSGRDYLEDALRRYHPGRKNHEVVLVCMAAMYYAGILEKKWHIEVISAAKDYVSAHKNEVMGKFKSIVYRGIKPMSSESLQRNFERSKR